MARNKIAYILHFKSYLKNIPKLLTPPLGTFTPRNIIMEQRAQVSFPTEIVGSENISVGIAHLFRTHRANRNDRTIQPTIIHSNQSSGQGHSDGDYSPLGSLDSGTDAQRGGSGRNIDNCTGVNPQGVTGVSVHAPRQRNSTYIHTVRRSIYDTIRPEHPYPPIHQY